MISQRVVTEIKNYLVDKISGEVAILAGQSNIQVEVSVEETKHGRTRVLEFKNGDEHVANLILLVDRKPSVKQADNNIVVALTGSSQIEDNILISGLLMSEWNNIYALSVGTDSDVSKVKRIMRFMYPIVKAIAEVVFVKYSGSVETQ